MPSVADLCRTDPCRLAYNGSMRSIVLVWLATAGCGQECHDSPFSPTINSAVALAAGGDRVAASFEVFDQPAAPDPSAVTHRVVTLAADGTVIGEADVTTATAFEAAVGSSSVLWHGNAQRGCRAGTSRPLGAVLVPDGEAGQFVEVSAGELVAGHTVAFVAGAYQVIWQTPGGALFHRSLAEDATLGVVNPIAGAGACLFAVGDDTGALLVTTTELGQPTTIVRVDPATGGVQPVFTVQPGLRPTDVVWFAGELHLRDGVQLESIDVATGTSRRRTLPEPAFELVAASSTLLLYTGTEVLELDAELTVLHHHSSRGPQLAALDADWVSIDAVRLDPDTLDPGHLDVVRGRSTTDDDVWRSRIATDSPVEFVELCNDRVDLSSCRSDCAPGQRGAGIVLLVLAVAISCRRRRAA